MKRNLEKYPSYHLFNKALKKGTNDSSRDITIQYMRTNTICSYTERERFPTGFANVIDEWSQCDFCFTYFGVILEYLESSITTKKAIFRLSSTWSWHVYTIVRDTRSSCGGPLTWKAQIHDGGHRVNFDRNLPSSCFVVQYNSLILMI